MTQRFLLGIPTTPRVSAAAAGQDTRMRRSLHLYEILADNVSGIPEMRSLLSNESGSGHDRDDAARAPKQFAWVSRGIANILGPYK